MSKQLKQINSQGFVLWFTGLSGAGKTTLANAVKERLENKHQNNLIVLDGDKVRQGLCSDLSFSEQDRIENIRRIGEVSKLLSDNGLIVLVALISPYRKEREKVRNLFSQNDFLEIYCKCDIKTCQIRDPKQLYEEAQKGEIENFTGISAPYEPPINPEITIDTDKLTVEQEVDIIVATLLNKHLISAT